MKDAEGRDIIPGDLYRNVEAITLDFDPSISKLYLVRQLLPSGLLVAKDALGVYRRVRPRGEAGKTMDTDADQSRAVFERVYASQLYHCSEQDMLCLQDKLMRTQERVPKLLSLLAGQTHFRQFLEDASRTVATWPDWKRNALGSLSQPSCTPMAGSQGDGGSTYESLGRSLEHPLPDGEKP